MTVPYLSAGGRFSVQFPGTPTQSDQNVTLGDSMTIRRSVLENSNLVYMVMYNDYPATYVS